MHHQATTLDRIMTVRNLPASLFNFCNSSIHQTKNSFALFFQQMSSEIKRVWKGELNVIRSRFVTVLLQRHLALQRIQCRSSRCSISRVYSE